MTTNARLRALVELADTGSVRGAAERLVVTESAISSALSSLSGEIGVPLVDRHGRGVRLTAAGRRYAEYVHFPARADDGVRPGHERVAQHCQQIREIDPVRVTEPDDQHGFVCGVGMFLVMNGFEVSTTGTRWKLTSV